MKKFLINLVGKLSPRERLMGLLFVVAALLIWGSMLLERRDAVRLEIETSRQELDIQRVWLRNSQAIESNLQTALNAIDNDRTFPATELVGLIDRLAREQELRHELSAPLTEHGDIFSQHSVRITLRNLTLPQLVRLEQTLHSYYPYLSLEQISITANRADPSLLNANMTVSAFELRYDKG